MEGKQVSARYCALQLHYQPRSALPTACLQLVEPMQPTSPGWASPCGLVQQQPTGPAASWAVPPEISRSFVHLRGRGIKTSMGEKKQNQKKTILSESTKLTPPHTHTASSCPSVLFTAPRPSNTQPTDCFACLKQCPVWPSTSYTHSKH